MAKYANKIFFMIALAPTLLFWHANRLHCKAMKVLIACEESGAVRDAFIKRGHDARSCDILPSQSPKGPHYQEPVEDLLKRDPFWDLMVCFPPCTHLAVSGARWFKYKRKEQAAALDFVRFLLGQDQIAKIALENPVSIISSKIRPPDQYIQPYEFGHAETKKTGIWLMNLPKLYPTNIVKPDFVKKPNGEYYRDKNGKPFSRIHFMSGDQETRRRLRSKTFPGIAQAMAEQWG